MKLVRRLERRSVEGAALAVALAALVAGAAAADEKAPIRAEAESDALQALLDRAPKGAIIELAPGRYSGPIRIDESLTLRGSGAVITGGGVGTVLTVAAPGVRIEGLTIEASGSDVGAPDACIYVAPSATGAVLRGNTLRDCAFGIWVHETKRAQIIENRVSGRPGVRMTDRGNGIHLFDASELVVRANEIRDVRDGIYVSATEDSLIEANRSEHVRFGVHYMFSYGNTLRHNVTNHNKLGIALMESRNLIVEDNRAADNQREGLLFRDVQDSEIRRNRLERNGTGMFFFSSTENVIEDNVIADNEIGLKIWAGTRRNRMEGNAIRGNRRQVFFVGAEDQRWGESGRGNFWGDYLGWDQNRDGVGDRPHRVDSFTAGLLFRYPSAALLLRSPALETLAHLADRLPMLRTPTIVDVSPLLGETSGRLR